MAGTTAYHHCLVRHQIRATTMTQTPMTISVLPMCDHTIVTEFISRGAAGRDRLAEVVLRGQPTERAHDEEADADDRGEEHERGRERAHGEVTQSGPDRGSRRVQLVTVHEGVVHVVPFDDSGPISPSGGGESSGPGFHPR